MTNEHLSSRPESNTNRAVSRRTIGRRRKQFSGVNALIQTSSRSRRLLERTSAFSVGATQSTKQNAHDVKAQTQRVSEEIGKESSIPERIGDESKNSGNPMSSTNATYANTIATRCVR
jgi:hypothetical protein